MMPKYLYKNFLKDKREYNLNRGYWKRLFSKLGEDISSNLYNQHFSNGNLFYDGNPIFSTFVPSLKKSVRIIQEEAETETVEIGAWTECNEYKDEPIQELVISLELSKESVEIARRLIEGWLKQDWNSNRIDEEISIVPSVC